MPLEYDQNNTEIFNARNFSDMSGQQLSMLIHRSCVGAVGSHELLTPTPKKFKI